MAPTFMTSRISPLGDQQSAQRMKYYMVEVTDFDGNQSVYYLDARSDNEACQGALALASADGIQICQMLVYEF